MSDETKTPRREREKQRQRQEILDAALALFSEKGYHSVTVHEIAQKAEFAIGTLYKFFTNKEDLYRALILESNEIFYQALMQALNEPLDETGKLRAFIRAKAMLFRGHVPFIRLYFSEVHGESFNKRCGLDAEIHRRHALVLQALAEVFASGIRKNTFRPIAAPQHLALALDGMNIAFLFRWLEDPEPNPYPEDPDVILNILFQGLIPGGNA